MFNGVAEKISLVLDFLVFALALSIRLPFALYTSVLDIREAEYLDLARYFAKEGAKLLNPTPIWGGWIGTVV